VARLNARAGALSARQADKGAIQWLRILREQIKRPKIESSRWSVNTVPSTPPNTDMAEVEGVHGILCAEQGERVRVRR
jgi:hypothetical protein